MPGADPTPVVLDASVVVRWLVPEPGSERAAQLLEGSAPLLAPRLMLTECAGALRRKVAGGEIAASLAQRGIQALTDAVEGGTIRLSDDEDDIGAALAHALATGRKVPDCHYLALAEREGAAIATADRVLDRTAAELGVPTLFIET